MKRNNYILNDGSGGKGAVITLRGLKYPLIDSENFIYNGDSYKERI